MPNLPLFNASARDALKTGVDKLADAVKITLGTRWRNVAVDLGRARQVTVTKDKTILVDGGGDPAHIKSRAKARAVQIRRLAEDAASAHDKEKFQERLAKLTGGVAVIEVGAATPLLNAASIAGLLLATDCLIAEKRLERPPGGKVYPEEPA